MARKSEKENVCWEQSIKKENLAKIVQRLYEASVRLQTSFDNSWLERDYIVLNKTCI